MGKNKNIEAKKLRSPSLIAHTGMNSANCHASSNWRFEWLKPHRLVNNDNISVISLEREDNVIDLSEHFGVRCLVRKTRILVVVSKGTTNSNAIPILVMFEVMTGLKASSLSISGRLRHTLFRDKIGRTEDRWGPIRVYMLPTVTHFWSDISHNSFSVYYC